MTLTTKIITTKVAKANYRTVGSNTCELPMNSSLAPFYSLSGSFLLSRAFSLLPSPFPPSPSLHSQMIRLYKDPKGDNLFPHVTHDPGITGVSAMQATQDDNQIHFLQKRVKQLEAQLTNSKVSTMLSYARKGPSSPR